MTETSEKKVSIVLRGAFNPTIVQPWWLAQKEFITEEEAGDADLKLITSELTQFTVGERFRLISSSDRFDVLTALMPYVAISDMVVRIFQEFLPETPIRSFGINLHTILSVGGWKNRDRMGRKLAPIEPWGDWASDLPAESPEQNGGMTDLVMKQTFVSDRDQGYLQARIAPFELEQVKLDVNNHFGFEGLWESKERLNGLQASELVSERFDDAVNQCERIVEQIEKLSKSCGEES